MRRRAPLTPKQRAVAALLLVLRAGVALLGGMLGGLVAPRRGGRRSRRARRR